MKRVSSSFTDEGTRLRPVKQLFRVSQLIRGGIRLQIWRLLPPGTHMVALLMGINRNQVNTCLQFSETGAEPAGTHAPVPWFRWSCLKQVWLLVFRAQRGTEILAPQREPWQREIQDTKHLGIHDTVVSVFSLFPFATRIWSEPLKGTRFKDSKVSSQAWK